MHQLISNIKTDILPVINGDLIALIETIAGILSKGGSLPATRERIEPDIRELLNGLYDWSKADPAILGYLYESLLEPHGDNLKQGPRRKSGIFYTPSYITNYLVTASINALKPETTDIPPTIIDPACGCGAFLLAAYRELIEKYPDAIRYLHGVDTDPDAIHVARLTLWIEDGSDNDAWEILSNNIRCGDSLRDFLDDEHDRYRIVAGNPPYRNVKRGISTETYEFCKSHYSCAVGQWDLSAPFIELALEHLLTDGGICAYILPNPILLAENYRPVREIILKNDLIAFGPAGRPFDAPGVEASLLVVRKDRPGKGNITILNGKKDQVVRETGMISPNLIKRLPFRIFSHLADDEFLKAVYEGLESGALVRLGDLVTFTRGIECGKKDSRVSIKGESGGKRAVPLIVGKDVTEYSVKISHEIILPEEKRDREKLLKDAGLWEGDTQLLLRRVAGMPIAAVSYLAALALNTLYIVRGENFDKYAACAIFNSSVFRKIFRHVYAFDDGLFPYLRTSQLKEMPVPVGALNDPDLAEWSRRLHEGKGDSGETMKKINRAVESKYFLRGKITF